jgi:hypothetical protein
MYDQAGKSGVAAPYRTFGSPQHMIFDRSTAFRLYIRRVTVATTENFQREAAPALK